MLNQNLLITATVAMQMLQTFTCVKTLINMIRITECYKLHLNNPHQQHYIHKGKVYNNTITNA